MACVPVRGKFAVIYSIFRAISIFKHSISSGEKVPYVALCPLGQKMCHHFLSNAGPVYVICNVFGDTTIQATSLDIGQDITEKILESWEHAQRELDQLHIH